MVAKLEPLSNAGKLVAGGRFIRETIAEVETGRVAAVAELAKSLPGKMRLFHIDGDEFELHFGNEMVEIAYASAP